LEHPQYPGRGELFVRAQSLLIAKKQAAQGEALSGLVGEVLRGGG
jgi:hypothetical protein